MIVSIYHTDGGRTYKEFPVKLEHSKGVEKSRARNGQFKLDLASWPRESRLYIGSDLIPPQSVIRTGDRVVVVLPSHCGKSGNLDAGIITGTVVQNGDPISGSKVEASVKSNKMFGFLSSPVANAVTSKRGKFVLEVEGGYQVQHLTVDGKTPPSITTRNSQGEEQDVPSLIRIGTFRLSVERKTGFLGI